MATVPSAESNAIEILDIFVAHFRCRSGHVLRINSFMGIWHDRGLHNSDFASGMEYAAEKQWVEVLNGGASFRLTPTGFAEAPSEYRASVPSNAGGAPFIVNNNRISIGTAINSQVSQGGGAMQTQHVHSQGLSIEQLQTLVTAFQSNLTELGLSPADEKKVKAQVATIAAQLIDEPSPTIVGDAARTIRTITEGAIGSLLASAAQPGIWAAVSVILGLL